MVVKLKVGRILPKNWISQQFRKAGGFFTFQSNMWEMWKTALNNFKKEAEKDLLLGKDTLNVSIVKDSEKYSDKNIQWLICECSSMVPNRELTCYNNLETLYNKIEKNYGNMKKTNNFNVNKPNSFVRSLFEKSKVAKYKIKDVIKKGLDIEGEKSFNDKMLELDILVDREKCDFN